MTTLKDVVNMTPAQITRAEWHMVEDTLRQAQNKLRGRQSWMDAAINLCRERGRGRLHELHDAEILVNTDITCNCPSDMPDEQHQAVCQPYQIFFLRTLHDPSVGIYGETISELFKSEIALETWLDNLSEADYNKLIGEEGDPMQELHRAALDYCGQP